MTGIAEAAWSKAKQALSLIATLTTSVAGKIGGSTGSNDNRLLRADGTGGATAQSSAIGCDDSGNLTSVGTINGVTPGNVVGPASATDNAVVRFDATTGRLVQNSLVTIEDSGNIALAALATIDGRDPSVDGTKLDGIAAGANVVGAASSTDGLPAAFSGTGGKTLQNLTAAQHRTNLGLALGSDVQAYGGTLTALEALSFVAGDTVHFTAADTPARLAKGSDGTVLTLASGLPSWAAAGGGISKFLFAESAAIDATTKYYEWTALNESNAGADFTMNADGTISLVAAGLYFIQSYIVVSGGATEATTSYLLDNALSLAAPLFRGGAFGASLGLPLPGLALYQATAGLKIALYGDKEVYDGSTKRNRLVILKIA